MQVEFVEYNFREVLYVIPDCPTVPRIDETIVIEALSYLVRDVIYNIDQNKIAVLVIEPY